jgi:hypothetical protein
MAALDPVAKLVLVLSIAATTAMACNPSSRLTPEEQAWCATHREEVAKVEEFARDQNLTLDGPMERRPMATARSSACGRSRRVI